MSYPLFTYLSRYPVALLLGVAAVLLLGDALRALRRSYRQQGSSVEGFFLLARPKGNEQDILSLPLSFLSSIGRSASSDIRLREKGIRRHHAQIYYYHKVWYLAPLDPRARILLNGKPVNKASRLRPDDEIELGSLRLHFIDEKRSLSAAAASRSGSTWSPGLEERGGASRGAAVCLFFYLLLSLLQLFFLLEEQRPEICLPALALAAVFVFLLLSMGWIWPRLFRHFDRSIFYAAAFLAAQGVFIQVRLSLLNRSKPEAWSEQEWLHFLQMDLLKQVIFPVLGLALIPLGIFLISHTLLLERLAPLCLVLTPAFYLLTKILGRDPGNTGARLWISMPFGLSLQLSEFAKISYLIVLAWFCKMQPSWRRQLSLAIFASVNFFLILLLPDLGSLMILLPLTLIVYTVMSSAYLQTFLLLLLGSGVFAMGYQLLPYVRRRIHGWLTLWTEVNAQNEQIIRGLRAIGRGGLFGLGLGRAEPREIPLASSDMIFSFLVEEEGMIVGLALLLFFMVIWLRGAAIFVGVRDGFSAALLLAISSSFFLEAAVVIAGTTGLIPLTGATLPFIARGGSSLLAKWLLLGLMLGLANRRSLSVREEGKER